VREAKARRETGILLKLRSIEIPEAFLTVPRDSERGRLHEAIQQSLEGGLAGQKVHEVPRWVGEVFKEGAEGSLFRGSVETGEDVANRYMTKESPEEFKRRRRILLYSAVAVGVAFSVVIALS
jgi:hypothetical protein